MLKPTRLEQGNEVYDFYESKNDNDKNISFHLFEVYKDKQALEFHKTLIITKITD